MKQIKNLLFVALFLVSAIVLGQATLSGIVLDDTGSPLPGASVIEKGTSNGTSTDFDGKFTITTKSNDGVLVISFVGFSNEYLNYTSGSNLGKIQLSPDNLLDEIIITGGGIIDLAEDRKTPIAVSTIKAAEIVAKAGNLDLPEILKETPSVQTAKGGGYGDARMTLRGFDQTNTAILLNGQPINSMEDGLMYWSNWSGVMDIANGIQVQRGLGASKLAISSVGGTVNIVTKTIDKKEGGFVSGMVGNDNYYKGNVFYSTGLMENGLAISAMAGHWQGDGYRNGTAGQGQTYFLSLGYKLNDDNIFNLFVTGAPQWHGDAWDNSLSNYLNSDAGRKFNHIYGVKDGEEFLGARNYYHKPVANLSWDWTINDRSTLSTVAYASWGRGGYAYPGRGLWGYVDSSSDGGIDYESAIDDNISGANESIVRSSVNSHNWYGLLTNYGHELNENLSLNVGADFRYYNGLHYRVVSDFLGLSSIENTNEFSGTYTVDSSESFNAWEAVFNPTDSHTQRIEKDYEEVISYLGGFAQLEYSKDDFSAFFQGALSTQSYQLENFYNYASGAKSDNISKIGYNIKTGLAYAISDTQKVFANTGYYSRQPYLESVFVSTDSLIDFIEPAVENEDILGFELGYNLNASKFDMNINLYHTTWGNRTDIDADVDNTTGVATTVLLSGLEQTHMGFELDFRYNITDYAKLGGFVSIGNWKYTSNATSTTYSDASGVTTVVSEGDTYYLEDRKVGGSAQSTFGWNVELKPLENLKIDLSQRYYTNMYSEVGANQSNGSFWTDENNLGAISLPGYSLLDLGASYKWNLGNSKDLTFRFNVNNLTDAFYIEWSDGTLRGGDTWKGVNTSNSVDIGFGRTWNTSVRFNF